MLCTPPCLPAIFTKVTNSCDTQFASLGDQNISNLNGQNLLLAPTDAIFLFRMFRVDHHLSKEWD